MTAPHGSVPTLTEVIAVVPDDAAASAPMPLAPDSVPLEVGLAAPPAPEPSIPRLNPWAPTDAAQVIDDLLPRLQPMLETWVRDRLAEGLREALQTSVQGAVQAAVAEAVDRAVRAGVEQAQADLARRLREDLPALARAALEAPHRSGSGS